MCQLLREPLRCGKKPNDAARFTREVTKTLNKKGNRYRAFYAVPAIFLSVLAKQLGKFSLLKGLAK